MGRDYTDGHPANRKLASQKIQTSEIGAIGVGIQSNNQRNKLIAERGNSVAHKAVDVVPKGTPVNLNVTAPEGYPGKPEDTDKYTREGLEAIESCKTHAELDATDAILQVETKGTVKERKAAQAAKLLGTDIPSSE